MKFQVRLDTGSTSDFSDFDSAIKAAIFWTLRGDREARVFGQYGTQIGIVENGKFRTTIRVK